MKEFFLQNYKYIIVGLCWLLNFIILLLKKNKLVVKDTIFENLLLMLPTLIKQAEESGGTGSDKKALVLSYALNWLVSFTSKTFEEIKSLYADRVSRAVEEILSTPQKKGN